MNKELMTETDAMGQCLGEALADNPSSFGADQAKKATVRATALLQTGRLDGATFATVIARIGNHSALRQWAIAHGFLKQPDDALCVAVREYLKQRDAALNEIE